jgi:long-chain acyl-CoA synthetase
MLYLRWLETSRRYAARPAIFDGDQSVSFAELAAMVESAEISNRTTFARTGSIAFFVELLACWKKDGVVLPVERDAPEPELRGAAPEGTRLIKYTPGASGVPRAIFLNDAQLIADGDRLFSAMGLSPDVPNLAVISLAHSYGFSNVVLPLVLHGVPVCLAQVPFPRVVEEICSRHDRIAIPAVPSIWKAWHRAGILKTLPIHLAVSAGAPLALALEQEVYESAGLKIHNFYGASECGGISYDSSLVPRADAGDVGEVLPGVTVTEGPGGRLLVESDAVAMGYDESRSDDLLEAGRYLTRDTGYFVGNGRLRLSGNTGGAINVSGRKISPAKVESALMATGLVTRARVFGAKSHDPERFEEIHVLFEGPATTEAVKLAVTNFLEPWELPRHWHLDENLWNLDAMTLRAMWSPKSQES